MADLINNIPDEEAEDITVELELEDGKIVNCAIITILEVDGKDYIALLPMVDEDDENYGDVWFYEYLEDDDDPDDEPELKYIEDDNVYEAVADAFDEFLDKQEYDEIITEEEEYVCIYSPFNSFKKMEGDFLCFTSSYKV